MRHPALLAAALFLAQPLSAQATGLKIDIHALDGGGMGAKLGTITAQDSARGLILTPNLTGLPVGPHGIHVHQNGDCGAKEQDGKMVPGLAAGSHFDPHGTGKHKGPWDAGGHKGDLPALAVNGDGRAIDAIIAPHLTTRDIAGRALIIHAGADNYSDDPKALGGGGARIACGLIK